MKVIIDGMVASLEVKRHVRIETDDFIFDLKICPVTKHLIINKVDGIEDGKINIFPKTSNEIEIK